MFAPPAHAGVAITTPANGAVLNAPPSQFAGTGSDLSLTNIFVSITRLSPNSGLVQTYNENTFADEDWSTPAAPFPGESYEDGLYRIFATQGGIGGGAVFSFFRIDSTPPDTQINSQPANPTNSTTATFTFSGNDPAPASGGSHFECSLDGATFTTCTTPHNLTGLSEGMRNFQVRGVDNAGNVDPTPASFTWMVDTTKPVITGPPNKQHFLLHDAVSLPYSCSDPLSGSPVPVASGIATCADTGGIDNETFGPHLFTVNSSDNATNTETKTVAYVIDPPGYGSLIAADNPIGYWRLDDAIGSNTMADSSANGNDGEYKNGIALGRDGATNCERRPNPPRSCELANPAEDNAAYFPPRDGYGAVQGIPAPTTGYTMEAWIKPASAGPMMIMGHGGNAGQLFIDQDQRLAFRQVQDTVSSPGPNIPVGDWTHVAASWDGTNTRLYVNGVLVAQSNAANKTPSGEGTTFYVGYGEQAPWFHGTLDEVAYYPTALSTHKIEDRYKTGTAIDHPSLGPLSGLGNTNTAAPRNIPVHPARGGVYSHQSVKNPKVQFACSDPDGPGDIASCGMTIDGNPVTSGVSALPVGVGTHNVTITAADNGGNSYTGTYQYFVKGFSSIMGHDSPISYFRLGDGAGASVMESQFGPDGEYKNKQDSGPVGIAGDGDKARSFEGDGGYGYANGISAPRFQSTMAAWIDPIDGRDQAIMGHGDAGELFIKDGTIRFRHMFTTVDSGIAPDAGFTHVVGVWDGVHAMIYINGDLEGSAEATRRPSSGSTLYVGYGELAPWFFGAIDEVVYYAKALSADRVMQHYLADPPPDGQAPAQATTPPTEATAPPAQATTPPSAGAPASVPADVGAPQRSGSKIGSANSSKPCKGLKGKKYKRCKLQVKAAACKRLPTKKKRRKCASAVRPKS